MYYIVNGRIRSMTTIMDNVRRERLSLGEYTCGDVAMQCVRAGGASHIGLQWRSKIDY